MINEDILNKIIAKTGLIKAINICEGISIMYDIKYQDCKDKDGLCEFDFERDWWMDAFNKLNKKIEL